MVSFSRAIDQGVELIELDVRLSRDGVPVVIHDERLARVTGRPGTVGQRSARHLSALDAGSWRSPEFAGARIPTLEEVLEQIAPRVPLNLELKCRRGDPGPLARAVASLLRGWGEPSRFLISSFRHDALPEVTRAWPLLKTAPLYDWRAGLEGGGWPALGDLEALGARPWPGPGEGLWPRPAVALHRRLLTEERARQLDRLGLDWVAWTVNDPEEMERLAGWGAAALISDAPALLRRVLEAWVAGGGSAA